MKNALKNGNRNIVIFVCEGRAKTKYRYNNRLLYSDGIKYIEELKKAESELKSSKNKFEITLIPDSCASNLFSNDCISKVIFGANGIGLTGKVAHNLGHLAIADMAMRYSVPVYVIADSLKISMDIDKLDKTSPRDDPWLTTDINFEKKLKGIKFYNPRGDFVPPGVLTAIVTEKGIIAPNKIKEHYDSFLEDYVISAPMRNALKSP